MSTIKRNKPSLLVTNPELAKEWDYEKNAPLTPSDITSGVRTVFGWVCEKGHKWDASVYHRVGSPSSKKTGCPYCSGKKVIKGENDLVTTHPLLASEWNYEKNKPILPEEIKAGTNKDFWWIDHFGHEWKAKPVDRSNGNGCPICANKQVLKGFNDLLTNYPDIAKEWDYEKNTTMTPCSVTSGSNKDVFWKCSKGHSWKQKICVRTKANTGCPYCSGRYVIKGENDLETVNPDLAAEWDYEKNGSLLPSDVKSGTNKSVYWKCSYGHSWKASINSRSAGVGCPLCSRTGSSKPEQGVAFYLSQVTEVQQRIRICGCEVDVYLPQYNIGVEYDGAYYHKNKHEQDDEKQRKLTDYGLMLYRIVESDCNRVCGNAIYYKEDRMGNNYEWAIKLLCNTIADISKDKSFEKIYISVRQDSLKIRERFKLYLEENSLENKYPDLAKEWDYETNGILKPGMFFPGSSEIVGWKCIKGHKWSSRIDNRVYKGNGCPYCSGRRLIEGETDLATVNPQLSAEWDYEKNSPLTPNKVKYNASRIVWWKDSFGHSWKANISHRINGTGCPYCSGKIVLPGFGLR